jgi:hypothetical protein
MAMTPRRIMPLAFAAVLVGGDAGTAAARGDRPHEDVDQKRVCIARREINAISALDDRHALVRLNAGEFRLLTLDRTCQGLRMARKIALDGTSLQVCDEGASLVSFEEPAIGPVRCRIAEIDEVASKSEALDLIDSRREPR